MEYLRIIGVVLLALSFVAAGCFAGRKRKKTCADTEELCALIRHIGKEIGRDRTELPRCFSCFFDHAPAKCEAFSSGDYERALSCYDLDPAQKKDLLAFFCKLGRGTAQEEEARCGAMLDAILKSAESQKNELQKKNRVSLTLGVCAGAAVLLLFL